MKNSAQLSKKDELDIKEKRRQNQISIISVAVTFIVAIVSLMWNALLQRQATNTSNAVETTRVENGNVRSNYNGDDFEHPWRQWESPITPSTVFIGVERVVIFDRPFRNQPKVALGLSVIDMPPMDLVLSRLGFFPSDPKLTERIRHIHIYTEPVNESKTQFTVRVGIGLPTEAGKILAHKLESTTLDRNFIDTMRRYQQIDNRSNTLNSGEMWMGNFYREVGTIGITWIAQATEPSAQKEP